MTRFASRYQLYRFLVSLLLLTLAVISLNPSIPTYAQTEVPKLVVVPGTIQTALGCPGDWQPACEKTALIYDEASDVWTAEFELPAGSYEYKVAMNGTWDWNYGLKAERNGPNIKLDLAKPTKVRFVYSNATHWVTDSVNSIIANVPGSYQKLIGCPDNWQPACLRSWLQDPDGDGVYQYIAKGIPEGEYEAKVAVDLSWGLNYGANGAKDGSNIPFTVTDPKREVVFEWDSQSKLLKISVEGAPKGNIRAQKAHWVTEDTIAWKPNVAGADLLKTSFKLHFDPTGAMKLDPTGIIGGESLPLKVGFGLSTSVQLKFPHLKGFQVFRLPPDALPKAKELLKGQLAISATDADGYLLDAAGIQIPGALDALYSYQGELGVSLTNGAPTLRLWAPTARSVTLHLFDNSTIETGTNWPMSLDEATGVWTIEGEAGWVGKYYLYEVEVYVPSTGKVEKNVVTDPYSVSLSMNSTRSQIDDLADAALKPEGWNGLAKPELKNFEDIVLYELHVRDFSVNDQSVPAELRGTYMAFTQTESNGMKHLIELAKAGLTHIHLLPIFDIATIDEDKSKWEMTDSVSLAALPPDSDQQQAAMNKVRGKDGFNWGYDPYHYGAPEGSYSTNPDGPQRIVEMRSMVKALNDNGLRVVMDVVYNHTNAAGQDARSVLDKIVPGYYYRLNLDGKIETSTCCPNTATEHAMMEKLMIDTLIRFAKEYKVDGFRFDLMGHHMVANMVNVRKALDGLTLEKDGVDGKMIYLYGEGWNFGEVADNARGKNATQLNMAGTGIGTFNDRLRDAVRGGSPFSGRQEQGFATGLYDNANGTEQGSEAEQKTKLLLLTDNIKIGLAGNLAGYKLTNAAGSDVAGAALKYNGAPAGYTADPQENIIYVEAHDNETFFDMVQYKAPTALPVSDRVRMQNMGMSLVALSQGVPFIHAGQDMLRSKSGDRDSYDHGDWFNALDFTYEKNNWGIGLPDAEKNKDQWPILKPLLANPAIKPGKADILQSVVHLREMLRIRKSSGLFRLTSAEEIQKRLKFLNVGPEQTPGVIVMRLDNSDGAIDGDYKQIVVVFNATKSAVTVGDASLANAGYVLHPVQAESADMVVMTSTYDAAAGSFSVPAYTTAVFVMKK